MSELSDLSKDELLEKARENEIPGRSSMTKEELQAALGNGANEPSEPSTTLRQPSGNWFHDHLLSLTLFGLFFISWIGQLYFQYRQEVHEALQHGDSAPAFFSSEFWVTFMSSVLENWQSEFLQLATMVLLTAYLIHRDSPQSRDSSDEMSADIKAIRAKLGA